MTTGRGEDRILPVPALRFDQATRVHGSGAHAVTALRPTSFIVAPGEFVAIMGPSGSGKSTLLSLAGTLDRPTGGRVLIHGDDLGSQSAGRLAELRRRVIGFVFQDLNLLPGLTAIENVALPLELDGMPLATSRLAALEALRGVQMEALSHRFPDNLSGGEQQRVAIARAVWTYLTNCPIHENCHLSTDVTGLSSVPVRGRHPRCLPEHVVTS